MAKIKNVNVMHLLLMLFAFFVPTLGSATEKRAIVYISLCVAFLCIGYVILKNKRIVLTKSFIMFISLSCYTFLQMIWVSDKGCQFTLGALFLMCAAGALSICEYKRQVGYDNACEILKRLVFSAALLYAVTALLWQIFIESSFIACRMDFLNGSATATACVMIAGMIAMLSLFGIKKNKPWVYAAFALMLYVFIMTKSLLGYLAAAVIVFVYFMKHKHKRSEAFAALVVVAVLSLFNVGAFIADMINNREKLNAAIKGLVSIFGVGCGGYNAANSIIDKAYEGYATLTGLMMEAFGVIGAALVLLWVVYSVFVYKKTHSFTDFVMVVFVVALMLSSSAAAVFMLPAIGMYYALKEDYPATLHLPGWISVICILLCALFAVPSIASVPYALAQNAFDMGKYEKSASLYQAGATLEMFNSHGWEKAYEAEVKAFNETGIAPDRHSYIDNAIKFNSKNYEYKRLKAEVYTSDGDYQAALDIWSGIITRYDREYLYPAYAQKILDVMKNCPLGLERMEELYALLNEYGAKAQDKNVILLVNNIITKSQQYYINAREGIDIAGDMYNVTEEVTEVEYESSNTEG